MLRYLPLGRTGLRVSEICLGTMDFGDTQGFWGAGANEATSRAVLDAFVERGGNFIDTANRYHDGQTEEILGRWLSGRRDQIVLATKYSLTTNGDDPNAGGNHRKNLRRALQGSLERLQTDYVDVLWVHAWDELTPLDETMRALDDVVASGMVHYVGISDAPAWVVSASNVLAELRGWTPYVGLQIEHSLIERTVERALTPMAEYFDMSVLAWAPLGGGVLTGKYTRGSGVADSRRQADNARRGRTADRNLEIARAVDAVADELGASSAQVATAWVMSRRATIPLVGARTVAQIQDTLGAAEIALSDEQLSRLDEVSRVPLGFPLGFLQSESIRTAHYGAVKERVLGRKARW
ncbi:aldo/keto reductase [Haliangium ochraceum]|uniref:Aldo/keto reductase n=1 Tax=Haliangium ochraceum (strain DSM 14365 / JCM 11303 / SMP-2) TaxID=502025 RepID=D0LUW1_HALO1|nr:aldo/keto reductase [Haliangium ochraceum]ACY14001.1 aldo/keto reductase [Haliangium ochraceum DSM 14365]